MKPIKYTIIPYNEIKLCFSNISDS